MGLTLKGNFHFLRMQTRMYTKGNAYYMVFPRCGGMGGRFPASPFFLPNDIPTWLRIARNRMPQKADVLSLRNSLQLSKNPSERIVFSWGNGNCGLKEIDDPPWVVLVTKKDILFSPAYDMEAQFLGFQPLKENFLYSVPAINMNPSPFSRILEKMAGLRLVVEPLAVGKNAFELVAAVKELKIGAYLSGFHLFHEQISKVPDSRLPRLRLKSEIAMALREADDNHKTETAECGLCSPRLVVLETSFGYLFGSVVFAPKSVKASFSDAPHQWSAGLPALLASVAVNIAAKPGDSLLDPCCGSGTILFEAHRRGVQAFGSDVQLGILRLATENLSYFGIRVGQNWGPTNSICGPHNPRNLKNLENRPMAALLGNEVVEEFKDEANAKVELDYRGVCSSQVDAFLESGVSLAVCDARATAFQGTCIVTNLPFDRFIKMEIHVLEEILLHLKGRAQKYVFFAGFPLTDILSRLGYVVIGEVSPCNRRKRFLCVAKTF